MKKKQLIYYGPPGTGKTFKLREKALDYLVGEEYIDTQIEDEIIEFNAQLYKNKFERFYNLNRIFLEDRKYKPGKRAYRNLSSFNKLMKLFIVDDTNKLNKDYVINELHWGGPSSYVQHERAYTNFDMTEEDWKEPNRENITLNTKGQMLKEKYTNYLVSNGVDLDNLDITSKDDGFPDRELPHSVIDTIYEVMAETNAANMTLWKNTIFCALWLILEQGYIFTYRNNTVPSQQERDILEKCFNYTTDDMSFLNWVVAYLKDLELITLSEDDDPRYKKYYLNSNGERLITNLSILADIEIDQQDEIVASQEKKYIVKQLTKEKRERNKASFYEYKNKGYIEMVTFHPSYEYEDFIEGISVKTENNQLRYFYKTGILKEFCTIALYNVIKNNFSGNENSDSESLEVLPSPDINWRNCFNYYKENRSSINWDLADNFVFIIDELNRGDVAKIFGECITILENDKRLGGNNEISVKLPFTHDEFGIPKNIIFLCTMNTSDKSIGSLDIALRRRFNFVPSNPDLNLIRNYYEYRPYDLNANDNLLYKSAKAIEIINQKIIEIPFIGPDKLIGHSVLMIDDVIKDEDILNAWKYDIFPMVEEYFLGEFETLIDVFNLNAEENNFISINSGFEKENDDIILGFINYMVSLNDE